MRKIYTAAELAAMTDDEMNDIVARVVMGWVLRGYWWATRRHSSRWHADDWCPTSDWGSCGLVIDRMLRQGTDISLWKRVTTRCGFTARLGYGHTVHFEKPDNLCRAICEAAVLATQAWRAARKGV